MESPTGSRESAVNHILYGLLVGHRYRRELGRALRAAPCQGTRDVDLVALRDAGIRALVFDFDGVLAPHGSATPVPETYPVLTRALELFGAEQVYLLSNKPSRERLNWFQQNVPGIVCIGGVRKKPFPDGLAQITQLGGYSPDEVALLDDRLLTGGLACFLAGTKFIYISNPYVDYSQRPVKECFFSLLRFTEKLLSRLA